MKLLARTALQYYVRHFPVSRGKNRLISALWKPLSFGQYQCQTTLSQARLKINCDLTQNIQRNIYFWGNYEPEYCEYWIKFARHSRVVFDIGANVGVYSLLAAAVNPKASIHAFEPTPAIFDMLTKNIRLNDLRNIHTNAVGVGSRSGRAILRECRGSNGANEGMNFVVNNALKTDDSDLPIPLTSLDDYCGEVKIDQIDIIKMDIEGGEYAALQGARKLLQEQAIKCIFLELTEWAANRSGHSTIDIKRILREAGYRIYQLDAGKLSEDKSEGINESGNVLAFARDFTFS